MTGEAQTTALDGEEGLQIVLTPIQLTAVMQGETIEDAGSDIWIRLTGGLILVGGGLETAVGAGLLLTPEPTMATKVGGAVLLFHGADTFSTGFHQIRTGRPQSSVTQQLTTAAAQLAGASAQNAGRIGMAVDILVPLLVSGGLAAARALSVRRGVVNLAAEEAAGGHTIARHVGRTEAQLRQRLAAQPGIPAASTFASREVAE